MATENHILSALNEQVSNAEDAQNIPTNEVDVQASTNENQDVDSADEKRILDNQEVVDNDPTAPSTQCAGEDQEVGSIEDPIYTNDSDQESYASMNKEELVDCFANMLNTEPVQTLRRSVEAIKIAFYKLHRAQVDSLRAEFISNGGAEEEFTPPTDETESRLKELFKEYRKKRDELSLSLENQKEENLQLKLKIIEELKELINSDETLNHTFSRFRDLQQRWKEIGLVPQSQMKDLWETYNLHIENFYNFIKINKELRDLDLKKNAEIKTSLCEQAEALSLETSIVDAFRKLQKLHDEWRETGPVANEIKDSLWERFKAASSKINKLHQEYFESLKSEQLRNLELKTELCQQTEDLLTQVLSARKDWNKASEKLLSIQKVWKSIGFAPKKDNNRIYERFRAACDKFFEAKREFYAGVKGEMDQNLQLKSEICEAAEILQNSDDWKSATDELIELQNRWKSIGAVPRRYSDQIWKRFRAACDAFFARKSEHFAGRDNEQETNLTAKKALLEEMRSADVSVGGFDAIKEFQRRWSELGYVPIKFKDSIQKEYRQVVDSMFATLRGSEREHSMNKFKERVSTMKNSGDKRLKSERERLMNKIRQAEADIALLENNIGFFANSKGAEAMIADVKNKIERAKQEMRDTIEKVKLLDKEEA